MIFVGDGTRGRWYSRAMVPVVDGTHMHTCRQKEKPNQTVFSVIRYMYLPAGIYDDLRVPPHGLSPVARYIALSGLFGAVKIKSE